MTQRRNVLKAVGGLAAIGSAGSVSAKRNDKTNKDIAPKRVIDREIQEAVSEHGVDGVELALKERGLNYNLVKKPIGSDDSDSEIGIQDRYSDSSSWFLVTTYEVAGEDRIGAQTFIGLRGHHSRFRSAAHVSDVISITFNDEHWAEVSTPVITVSEPYTYSSETKTNVSVHQDSSRDEYAAGKVDISTEYPEADIMLSTELQHISNVPNPIWGEYKHNRAYTPRGSISDIDVEIPYLSVNLSNADTAWDKFQGAETDDLV